MNWQKWLYNGAITCYGALLYGAAWLGNERARAWVEGRKQLQYPIFSQRPVLFHASSLGEFEMALPVLRRFQEIRPEIPVCVSFFSPSGYQYAKVRYPTLPMVFLPLDQGKAMESFLARLNPRAIIFSKYDFWPNLIWKAHAKGVPLFVFAASFFPKWYYHIGVIRSFYRELFQHFKLVLVQTPRSERLYRYYFGLENVCVGGDPRFDRVLENKKASFTALEIEKWKGDMPLLVAGSTWEKDEILLAEVKKQFKGKVIVVPHLIHQRRLLFLKRLFPNCVFWSQVKGKEIPLSHDILVIDEVGILKYLYRYGDIAYVGGGFDDGIHNILEAVVYEKPTFFGPKYQAFWEAVELTRLHCAFSVANSKIFISLLLKVMKPEQIRFIQRRLHTFLMRHSGATEKIVSLLAPYLS